MILVLLGSHEFQFNRLLENIEKLIVNGVINEEVVAQSGCTEFKSTKMKLIPFMKSSELDILYDKANLIITHGGTASIIKGVKKGKKVLGVARLKKYGEHIDDHQLQIISEFVKSGYILEWTENKTFVEIKDQLKQFIPEKYISNRKAIIDYIDKYISNLK